MKFTPLKFNLPEWKPSDFQAIEQNKKKMAGLLGKTGRGSDKFQQACERIKKLLRKDQPDAISQIIKTPTDVRALTYLFGQQQDFRVYARLSKKMLDCC